MKIKKGFVLKTVADNNIVVPVGDAALSFSGMVQLNESGTKLWKLLEEGADKERLIAALIDEYGVSETVATFDVDTYLQEINDAGLLELLEGEKL